MLSGAFLVLSGACWCFSGAFWCFSGAFWCLVLSCDAFLVLGAFLVLSGAWCFLVFLVLSGAFLLLSGAFWCLVLSGAFWCFPVLSGAWCFLVLSGLVLLGAAWFYKPGVNSNFAKKHKRTKATATRSTDTPLALTVLGRSADMSHVIQLVGRSFVATLVIQE